MIPLYFLIPIIIVGVVVALTIYLFIGLSFGKLVFVVAEKFDYLYSLGDFADYYPVLFSTVWPIAFAAWILVGFFTVPYVLAEKLASKIFRGKKNG